jgi:hypothetical protein
MRPAGAPEPSRGEPHTALRGDHAPAHRAPVDIVVIGPQIPGHRARARIDSTNATVPALPSFTPTDAPKP